MKGRNHSRWRIGVLWAMFVTLLVFVILKLTGAVLWTWLWVISPLWIPVSLAFVIISIVIIIAALRDIRERRKRRKWR